MKQAQQMQENMKKMGQPGGIGVEGQSGARHGQGDQMTCKSTTFAG